MGVTSTFAGEARYLLYLPKLLLTGPKELRSNRTATLEGSVIFADVSGFTALSEELARQGKVGAEQITEIINGAFTELLTVSRLEGGDVISFGGDATLLLFTGPEHARRAATAAFEMGEALSGFAAAESTVPLSMSQGVVSGEIIAVIAGSVCRQLLLIGDVIDQMIELESAAGPGEILVSDEVAAGLEPNLFGEGKSGGRVLKLAPQPSDFEAADYEVEPLPDVAAFIPPDLRDELLLSGAQGEHRDAVVGFVRADGVKALLDGGGPDAAREGLEELIDSVSRAAADHQVSLLSSDVSKDGVKIILTAGVPRAVAEPEERMLRTLRRIVDTPTALNLHVGAASGPVFSGDLGATFRRGYTVMGDTVNLAARLTAHAARGQILTTWRVVDACRTSFEVRQLPPVELRGKSVALKPLELGSIIAPVGAAEEITRPLVGRSEELAVLIEAAEALSEERGRLIELHGAIGIGKSRLLHELRRLNPQSGFMIFECEEYESATPYWVAGLLVRHLIDMKQIQSASEIGDRLAALVSELKPGLLPWLPLLAVPLGATVPPTDEVASLGDEFRLPKLFEVVGELLVALMSEQKVLAFDNAQWMDPASSELLQAVMLRHAHQPWLWLWAHREVDSTLSVDVSPSSIKLEPLSDEQARVLVRSVNPETPPSRLDEIVEKGGGNPLFLTELAASPAEEGIPDSVERLFAAHIDALGPRERRLLREAAVLGQQFELDMLVESLGAETPGVDDMAVWERLSEFLHLGGTGQVRFVQPLVRDVAYEGLPFRRRRQLHNTVGETIEKRARHRAERQAAVLSLHFFNGERYAKAWNYARIGAERAAERYANREAITLYERALEAGEQEQSISTDEKAQVAERLGDAAELAADYAKSRWAYGRAETLDDGSRRAVLARKKALLHEKAGEYEAAIDLLETALEDVVTSEDVRAEAMVAMAGVRYRQGDFASSAEWCQKALDVVAEIDEATAAHARYLLSLNQTHLGNPGRVENAHRALEIYENLGNWVGAGKVLNNLGIDAYYDGRWSEAIDLYSRSHQASERAGDLLMQGTQDNNLAEIYSDQGLVDHAEELFRRAESIWRPVHFEAGVALVLSNLGRLEVRRGRLGDGIPLLEQALSRFSEMGADAYVAETRMRLVEAELQRDPQRALDMLDSLIDDLGEEGTGRTLRAGLLRLRGHALALLENMDQARFAFEQALETATDDGLPFEAGLAARALGHLGDEEKEAEGERILQELGATEAVLLPLP